MDQNKEESQDVPKSRSRVTICFKSGNCEHLIVDELKVSHANGKIVKLSWTNAQPNIMFISLPDIEAIIEVPE